MSITASARSAVILLFAIFSNSCDFAKSPQLLTVNEAIPRIDELHGETVSVAGYLSECGGYECRLYQTEADSAQFMAALHTKGQVPYPDTLGIGSGTNLEFDAKAAPFTNSYVVITGTITNECRFEGKPACTDRSTDLKPTAIRAWNPPAGQ